MQRSRFATGNPSGSAALAADLHLAQHRSAHQRIDRGLSRWPAKSTLRFATIDQRGTLPYARPGENDPWAR